MDRQRGSRGRRSRSSDRWLSRQRRDPFRRLAAQTGKVSRAHFKLEQLDRRFRLLKPGMRVLELGAAPGGWTNYIEERIRPGGRLIAVDERPVTAGAETVVLQGRLGSEETDARLAALLGDGGLDLVLSDMAPNISGIRAADQARVMELVELAEEAADRWLKAGGGLLVKVFQGEGLESWIRRIRGKYRTFKQVKPQASRPDSREMFAVAQGFRQDPGRDPAGDEPGR